VLGKALEPDDIGQRNMVKRGEDGREKRPAILTQRLRRQLAGSRVELVIHPRVIAGN